MEVLIGIFILGIGVIAIAALFPAGIAQQQYSNDDVIGSVVANNAMAVIRGKVSAADFGTYEEFGVGSPRFTISGDWPWIRPGIILSDDPGTGNADERGTVDLFGYARANGSFLTTNNVDSSAESFDGGGSFWSIPFNSARYGNTTPLIAISQAERYFPQQSELSGSAKQPQYVWDCMFRRYEGRIYVAIFVYRVADPEAQANGPYRVAEATDNALITPIPRRVEFSTSTFGPTGNFGVWQPNDNPVDGVSPANSYAPLDPDEQDHAWQEPRQWLVDQNTNVHRVLSNFVDDSSDPLQVELVRPVPGVANLPTNWFGASGSPVSDVWYVPLVDSLGRSLTPVFVSVQEL